MANAFGLVQQAMEMALKGRIASISPLLLISRNPNHWPNGIDKRDGTFSEFRTLDATDLVKVHNAFCSERLDEHFVKFWDGMRRDRNKIMHSASSEPLDPATLVRTIIMAAHALFADVRWPQRLLDMEADDKYAAYGLGDQVQNVVMRQIDIAVRHLTSADSKLFFGYDVDRRSYVCPKCYDRAEHWPAPWPALAQFLVKSPGERELYCIVCSETVEVERISCVNPGCPGDVIHDGMCLTCVSSQDDPHNFRSGLVDEALGHGHRYSFIFKRGAYPSSEESSSDAQRLLDDEAAKNHARLAMLAPHLASWDVVMVSHDNGGTRAYGRSLGSWVRREDELTWLEAPSSATLGEALATARCVGDDSFQASLSTQPISLE